MLCTGVVLECLVFLSTTHGFKSLNPEQTILFIMMYPSFSIVVRKQQLISWAAKFWPIKHSIWPKRATQTNPNPPHPEDAFRGGFSAMLSRGDDGEEVGDAEGSLEDRKAPGGSCFWEPHRQQNRCSISQTHTHIRIYTYINITLSCVLMSMKIQA